MKYLLEKDVFYRKNSADDSLIVKTDTKDVYVFKGNICEILDFYKRKHSIDELIEFLSKKYTFEITNIFKNQIIAIIKDLTEKKILKKENILTENKSDLESLYQFKYLPQKQLFSAQFELTYNCNEKCRHCYCVQTDKEELTNEEIKKVLDDLYDMGAFEITFTGGDLFTRKNVFEILEYAYKKNFLINIFTNGLALTDSDIIKLKDLHIKSIHFSIYSAISEKHDYFTQVKGSFHKTIDVIKKCVLLGIPVNIKTCILNYNETEIDNIMKLAKDLGTTIQLSLAVSSKNNGDSSPTQYRLENIDKYTSIMQTVNQNMVIHCSNDFNLVRECDGEICGAGKRSININPYGDVYPCNALLIKCGNLKECNIKYIWENSKELKRIRKYKINQVKGCENCCDKEYCNFCPGSALTETGDPLKKYSEACNITEAKKKLKNKEGGL